MSGFTIDDLTDLGLANYEARICLALLEKKRLAAAEVARIAGVPRTRVYDNLKSLELKGLCQVVTDKTRLYSVVDPSRFMEILVRLEKDRADLKIQKFQDEIKKEKDRLVEKMKSAEDLLEKMSPVYQEGRDNNDVLDYIEIIRGPEQIDKKVTSLYGTVEKELLSFCPPSSWIPHEVIMEQLEQEKECMRKGARCASIYEIPSGLKEIEWLRDYIDESTKVGEQARVIDQIPVQMFIIDEKCVFYQLEDPISLQPSATVQVVQHTRLAKSFKILFETVWQRAKDVKELDKIINNMRKNNKNGGI